MKVENLSRGRGRVPSPSKRKRHFCIFPLTRDFFSSGLQSADNCVFSTSLRYSLTASTRNDTHVKFQQRVYLRDRVRILNTPFTHYELLRRRCDSNHSFEAVRAFTYTYAGVECQIMSVVLSKKFEMLKRPQEK